MRLPYTDSQGSIVHPVTMAVTKSAELKNSLLQMYLFHLQRFSHLLKLIFLVLTKTGIIFNAHLFAELFFLFVFLSVPGLILGVWDLVP